MPELNDRSTPMSLLLTRRSAKPRDMVAPGPDESQLRRILTAAARVPDHGKLAPWRFCIVTAAVRDAFARRLQAAYLEDRPDAGRLERDAVIEFARQAPCLVVVLHCPRPDSHIPLVEQASSASAAAMTLVHAAHAAGYAACWLTGWAAYSPAVRDLFGKAPESIVGFIFIGTPGKPVEERPRPMLESVVSVWNAT